MKNRDIKFKVWEIAENRFVDYYDMSPDVVHVAIADHYFLVNNEEKQEFILCQYTGLKDKNGKEIYEGDILSDWTETDEGKIQSKMQVFWCDITGAWRLDNSFKQNKSSGDLLSDELIDFVYEITGNIHENPDLLK